MEQGFENLLGNWTQKLKMDFFFVSSVLVRLELKGLLMYWSSIIHIIQAEKWILFLYACTRNQSRCFEITLLEKSFVLYGGNK